MRRMAVVAQKVRASDCGSGGHGFDPHQSPKLKRLHMNKFFTSVVLTATTLIACNNEPEVRIMGTQQDFVADGPKFVPDSVYFANQAYIDSLTTVTELLDHLETLPTE